jgi:hypothetical protein
MKSGLGNSKAVKSMTAITAEKGDVGKSSRTS